MAALNQPTFATYEVHESVRVDTSDNEDHTFSGIIFPIKAKQILPVEKIIVHSISIRGQLGPVAVYVANESNNNNHNNNNTYSIPLLPNAWTKIYEQFHPPSQRTYQKLDLRDQPVELTTGQMRALYIHSSLPGDEAIVYDNSYPTAARRPPRPRYQDSMIAIHSGKAHLSPEAFGQMPIWGWGNAWRDHREFVGQIEYGCVYKLWRPEIAHEFGSKFHRTVVNVLLCQRRKESPWHILPDECIYYVFNMCRWDWFGDVANEMKIERRARKRRQMRVEVGNETEEVFFDAAEEENNGNMEVEDADDDESNESEWERANGYRADTSLFTYHDVSSDEEVEASPHRRNVPREVQEWIEDDSDGFSSS